MGSLLFNMYIVDIDKLLKEREVEDIAIGNDRIWTITYADNIVLVAKNRVAIQDMIGVLRDFLREGNWN